MNTRTIYVQYVNADGAMAFDTYEIDAGVSGATVIDGDLQVDAADGQGIYNKHRWVAATTRYPAGTTRYPEDE